MVDANTLFSGSLWPRFPYEVLQHAVKGDYQLVLSPSIIEEARIAIIKVTPGEENRLDELLALTRYEEVSTPSAEEIQAHLHLVPRDPKDVHVVLAAIRGKADYLISLDRDITDPDEPAHQHIQVLLPAIFLREFMGWSSEALEQIRTRKFSDL